VDAFTAKYNETPSAMAALGYDAYMLIIDAIKRANSFDPKAIRDAIAATKDYQGVTGSITINENGDAVKDAVVLVVENGVFKYRKRLNRNLFSKMGRFNNLLSAPFLYIFKGCVLMQSKVRFEENSYDL